MGLFRQINRIVSREDVLLIVILLPALIIRLILLLPGNTFITDEAYYLGAGVEVLQSKFVWAKYYHPTTTGSVYIFPLLAGTTGAFFERFGINGLVGIRILNILINILTTAMVYWAAAILAKRWSDDPFVRRWMAPFAAIIFGLSSTSLYIGTLATYDALSTAFLALGIWRLLWAMPAPAGSNDAGSDRSIPRIAARRLNAGLAGIAVALGMMTRFYPLIYTPVIGLMLIVVVPWFFRQHFKLKTHNESLSILMIFLLAFIIIFGSYMAVSFPYVKAASAVNQKNVEGQSNAPAWNILRYVFERWGVEVILAIAGFILLLIPALNQRMPRFLNLPISTDGSMKVDWKRCIEMAPLAMIPCGGIAFQILFVRNYFALTKNMIVPVLALALFAGYFLSTLAKWLSGSLRWPKWVLAASFLSIYGRDSIVITGKYHVWGVLIHGELVPFLEKQLEDPHFAQRYALAQSHIGIVILPVLVIAVLCLVAFIFRKEAD
jgi:4-amino-4-deoxy-L-arabinose transferase-like glycosyltransferase